MTLPAFFALAGCLAVSAHSDRVTAGDLAPATPALASLPADTVVAWAPAPGAQRLFSAAELKHLAERLGAAEPAPVGDVCVERRVEPLDAARVLTELRS